MQINRELETLFQAVEIFERTGISYMLTGSLAKSLYATPRMTRDIDIVVELESSFIKPLVAAMEASFFIDEEMISNALSSTGMFNILHLKHHVKVDLILRKNETYRKTEFARRRQIAISSKKVWVVSPEDLVLSKLCWAKDSLSEVQLRDVQDLTNIVDLDKAYIREWVDKLSLSKIFEKVSL